MTLTPEAPRHAAAESAPQRATPAEPTIGELVNDVTGSIHRIVQGEIKLAKLELRSTLKNAGAGVGMFAAAAVLLVFSLTFGLIALAEGLIAAGLWRWLGYLVVFAFLLVLIAGLVLLGLRSVKRVRAPQKTIDTTRDTVAYLKAHPKNLPAKSDS